MLGKDTCAKIRQKWMDIVPVLLYIATESDAKPVKSILRTYEDSNLLETYGKTILNKFKEMILYFH